MTLVGHIPNSRRSVISALARHWGALLALALFLAAGFAALDDYGVQTDEPINALRAERNYAFVIGGYDDFASAEFYIRLYGATFELALLFTERIFGLEDARSVYLSRHLQGHLFFLVGGLFAYLLALRLFGNRLLALLAMLLFLLHPRLYAHSFFNGKDIPFLAMFAVALFLTHRAFRRDSIAAFAILGAAVGLLVNLRIMGLVLFAAVPALRALDFAFAPGWAERKRVLASTGAFALASALTIFALLPYLWGDPLARAVEWWTTLSNHPGVPFELFRGTLYRSVEAPFEYLPVWISITGPPFALLLGALGTAGVLVIAGRTPRKALQNARLRFTLLLAGCFALPVFYVMLPGGNIYGGWLQVYFLWAPFSLLAAFGLHWLASGLRRTRLRAIVYGAAGAGLAASAVSIALIHPHQEAYFNFFVDRVAPERLRTQYSMVRRDESIRRPLEWVASRRGRGQPGPVFPAGSDAQAVLNNAPLLPEFARERLANAAPFDVVPSAPLQSWSRSDRALHQVKVYANTIWSVEPLDDLRAVYEAVQERETLIDAAFDVHRIDGGLALAMEPCAPSFIEKVGVTVRAFPADLGDLPPWRRGRTFEARNFYLWHYGAFFEGRCVASLPLPAYPVADFELRWWSEPLGAGAAREKARIARDEGRLLSRADSPAGYDVYLSNGEFAYISDSCDPLETEHPFHINVFQENVGDLPEERRARGYERFHFEFVRTGAFVDGGCAAFFPLPGYPVAGAQTGQRREDSGEDLWRAEFLTNPEQRWAEAVAGATEEPTARGVFDIHLADGALVYSKEPCAQADTEARFFLHVTPEQTADLPEARRASGFDNLDFDFFLDGALIEGKCAARRALPDYPIASVRTGQHAGEGEIWSAEFAVQFPAPRQ